MSQKIETLDPTASPPAPPPLLPEIYLYLYAGPQLPAGVMMGGGAGGPGGGGMNWAPGMPQPGKLKCFLVCTFFQTVFSLSSTEFPEFFFCLFLTFGKHSFLTSIFGEK